MNSKEEECVDKKQFNNYRKETGIHRNPEKKTEILTIGKQWNGRRKVRSNKGVQNVFTNCS